MFALYTKQNGYKNCTRSVGLSGFLPQKWAGRLKLARGLPAKPWMSVNQSERIIIKSFYRVLLWRPKLRLNGIAKPKNNGLLRKKNTKGVILKQKGTRMTENGEDWNGLEMTILKSSTNVFKIHERWRRSLSVYALHFSLVTLDLSHHQISISVCLVCSFPNNAKSFYW